jgi:ribosomal-protein-alanine N-acetyltransferase
VPSDFEHLWQLDQACFSPEIAYSRKELAYYLQGVGAICVVANEESRIVGFIVGHEYRKKAAHLITLDVLPSVRNQGIGSRLMRILEKRLLVRGCRTILLEVAVNNSVALQFYKKHGYSVIKTLPRYYPGDLDGLLMGKIL